MTRATPALLTCWLAGLVLGVAFWMLSSGWSLRATFVPALVVTLLLITWRSVRRVPLPRIESLGPVYVVALAVQLIHFAEEFASGFPRAFPALYGGEPYALTVFVWFNMAAYAVFALSALALLWHRVAVAEVPVVFFIVYGVLGNAIAHTAWMIMAGGTSPAVSPHSSTGSSRRYCSGLT